MTGSDVCHGVVVACVLPSLTLTLPFEGKDEVLLGMSLVGCELGKGKEAESQECKGGGE